MKKLILSFAVIVFTFFSAQAQYDILLKQGVYNDVAQSSNNNYAYGANNSAHNHNTNYSHNDNHNTGSYPTRDTRYTNKRAAIIVKEFEVERSRKNQLELGFKIKGPLSITTRTQWRGTTLFVYLDYPADRDEQYRTNCFEIELGRLSKDIRYNVVVVDGNSLVELGQYVIN